MEMGGRTMEGYVHVAPEGMATEADLAGWLDVALAFAETLPPKSKPAKVAKRRAWSRSRSLSCAATVGVAGRFKAQSRREQWHFWRVTAWRGRLDILREITRNLVCHCADRQRATSAPSRPSWG
jgi:hypothetical protein